jgi:hypothetical protein
MFNSLKKLNWEYGSYTLSNPYINILFKGLVETLFLPIPITLIIGIFYFILLINFLLY